MSGSTKISLVVLSSLLLLLAACSKTEREEEVYRFIQQGVELAEAHSLGDLMDMAREGFIAEPGKRSSKEVRRILFVAFKRFGKFQILYPKPSVRLSEDEETAIVKMNFLITKKEKPFSELKLLYDDPAAWLNAVDERNDIYTLSMELEYESGDWMVTKARLTGFARLHGRL